jgi:antitoxin MazE
VLTAVGGLWYPSRMKLSIRQIGNSRGLILPKPLISHLKLVDSVELTIERDAVVLRKPKMRARQDWSKASKALAKQGKSGLVWPEFQNRADKTLRW